jgi:Spy/CpxP family protein refolding chaperone
MKRYCTTLIVLFILFLNASAQQKHSRGSKMKNRKENIETLQLTPEQKEKMKALRDEYKEKLLALESDQNMTLKNYNDKKTALRKELQDKRKSILTPDQQNKIAEIRKRKKTEHNDKAQKRLEHMRKTLSLSENQYNQLKDLQTNTSKSIESIKNNEKLNEQEKKSQLRALKNKNKSERENILTAEQKSKLEERKKTHRKQKVS